MRSASKLAFAAEYFLWRLRALRPPGRAGGHVAFRLRDQQVKPLLLLDRALIRE